MLFSAPARVCARSCFSLAVVAINYTWSRPSPVDIIFFLALLLTPFCKQTFNLRSVMLIGLVMTWLFSIYVSSVSLLDKPLVAFQFIALTSVVLIGITSCLVTTGWTERDLKRFVRVYVFATVIAAIIGIFGFVTKNPALTWADRPTAFLDDPDMFGVFLIPGMMGSLFMIAEGRGGPFTPPRCCCYRSLWCSHSPARRSCLAFSGAASVFCS